MMLSADKIADIINRWNDPSCNKLPHEPIEGQLSMEQAISEGKSWIDSMKEAGEFYGKDGVEFKEVAAVLETCIKPEESMLEINIYYSYWKINFSNELFNICLYMNAVTGQVWEAKVEIYDGLNEYVGEDNNNTKLEKFAELAGIDTEKIFKSLDEDNTAKLFFETSPLYVEKYIGNKLLEYQNNTFSFKVKMQE